MSFRLESLWSWRRDTPRLIGPAPKMMTTMRCAPLKIWTTLPLRKTVKPHTQQNKTEPSSSFKSDYDDIVLGEGLPVDESGLQTAAPVKRTLPASNHDFS